MNKHTCKRAHIHKYTHILKRRRGKKQVLEGGQEREKSGMGRSNRRRDGMMEGGREGDVSQFITSQMY
jgi:hypothetical protein